MGDWDEKDAFCNTVGPNLGAVYLSLGMLGIAGWAEEFFVRFCVRVVTPFGLGCPYRMAHGGGGGAVWGWVCMGAWTAPLQVQSGCRGCCGGPLHLPPLSPPLRVVCQMCTVLALLRSGLGDTIEKMSI